MGYCFCCFLRPLQDLLATESDCSCNDGVGKLFWGIKNLSSCCFLGAIKFLSHFIGKCKCKYAVRFKMKSREENYGCNRPIRRCVTKHYDWFALVNKRPSQGGGGRGYLFPCSPEINWLVPLFPKNREVVLLCSLFPNIVFVHLFPSKFGLCFPVPLK